MKPITRIPQVPDFDRGADQPPRVGDPDRQPPEAVRPGPPGEFDDETRTIVVNVHDKTIGCIVDEVTQVMRIAADQVQPVPIVGDGRRQAVHRRPGPARRSAADHPRHRQAVRARTSSSSTRTSAIRRPDRRRHPRPSPTESACVTRGNRSTPSNGIPEPGEPRDGRSDPARRSGARSRRRPIAQDGEPRGLIDEPAELGRRRARRAGVRPGHDAEDGRVDTRAMIDTVDGDHPGRARSTRSSAATLDDDPPRVRLGLRLVLGGRPGAERAGLLARVGRGRRRVRPGHPLGPVPRGRGAQRPGLAAPRAGLRRGPRPS